MVPAEQTKMRSAGSIAEVVSSGLCIGCGMCEAVTKGRSRMEMTSYGSLRPVPSDGFSTDEEQLLLSVCPGTAARSRSRTQDNQDGVWGNYTSMQYAWAGNEEVRFRAATGGVLTALGMHLISIGEVAFVMHVSADPTQPMRSRWVFSETEEEVLERTGSRYGPVAPLSGFELALERNEPFAVVAKPCDLGAIHALSLKDPRVDALCIMRMAMVCGGQSRLTKSQDLLDEFGIGEESLTRFRYRGHGNPGLTTIETVDGQRFQKTYQELWEDEGSWQLETRCKLCPDALGETADIVAADVWAGGGPSGEDEGFNGLVVRSRPGEDLVRSAVEAGYLVLGEHITPREFDEFQPHQVRKKQAVAARLEGLARMEMPVIETTGLRLKELGENLTEEQRESQIEGVKQRVIQGRFKEPLPETGKS